MAFFGDVLSNTLGSVGDIGKNLSSSLADVGKNTISSAQDIARNPVKAVKGALDNPIINPIGYLTSKPLGLTPTQSYEIGAAGGALGSGLGLFDTAAMGGAAGAGAEAGAGLTGGAGAGLTPAVGPLTPAEMTEEQYANFVGSPITPPTTAGGMSTGQKIALGLGGLNLLGTMGKGPAQPDQRLMGPASILQGQSQKLIDQAMKGQLNPGDQARLAQSRQADIARTQDYYAKAGLSDSSMAQQAITDINARYDAAAYQITQGYYQQGIQAAGIADQGVARAVQIQMQQDQQAQQAQNQFFSMLMQYGMSK